jgi:hypothetical protein
MNLVEQMSSFGDDANVFDTSSLDNNSAASPADSFAAVA